MPNKLSIATVLEKNRLDSDVPFLALLDIEVVDPVTREVVETVPYVLNDEEFVFNGRAYQPAFFDLSFKYDSNAAPTMTLTVNDFAQAIQSRMQEYGGGVGFGVVVTIANSALPNEPPETAERFEVMTANSADYIVTFGLGIENDTTKPFPRRRQTRDFCQHRYMGPKCRYGQTPLYKAVVLVDGDDDAAFRQTIPAASVLKGTPICFSGHLSGEDAVGRRFALEVLNSRTGTRLRTTFLLNDDATVTVTNVAGAGSSGWLRITPALIRVWVTLPTGFSATTEASDNLVLVFRPVLEADVQAGEGVYWGAMQLQFGALQPTDYVPTLDTTPGVNKLRYSNHLADAVWEKLSSANVAPAEQVGWNAGPNVGTLPTCDLTLQGPNGCSVHQNTLNFGGFPGIGRNGYSYV